MRLLACVSAAVVLLLASCGDDDAPSSTPTPVRSVDETPDSATPEPTHELFAEANKFDKDVLTAEPGQLIVLVLTNRDAGTHNFAVYTTPEAQEEIFVGETIDEADEQIVYEFDAPEAPGEYFFRCDVHPIEMTGELIVE
jgi:plastocyanin